LPLYEYECVKCGHRFEKIESASASTTKKCPQCGAKAERLLAAPAIQFKGSGWYVTDYAAKASGSGSVETAGDGDARKPDKPAETTGDAKTEPKAAPQQKKEVIISDSAPLPPQVLRPTDESIATLVKAQPAVRFTG
jgi:putative FmdB family regulatory protein